MHQVVTIGLLVLFGGALSFKIQDKHDSIEPMAFENMINETIESMRPNIPDPLKIDHLELALPGGFLAGSANVSNFEMLGLQSFQIPALHFAMIGMRLNFTFVLPSVNINTDYALDAVVADLIPFYGAGIANNIHFRDVEIQGSAQANLNGGIQVKNLRIQIYVGAATFDIHGALNNEDFSMIVNEILDDAVAPFIDNHQPFLSDLLSPILEAAINAILSGGGDVTTIAVPAFN